MPSATGINNIEIIKKDDLGEGVEAHHDDVVDDVYNAGNDIINDAELAARQIASEYIERSAALADRKHHKALKDSFDCSDPLRPIPALTDLHKLRASRPGLFRGMVGPAGLEPATKPL